MSVKLRDVGEVDKVVLNCVAKDLSDNAWSDLNVVRPSAFGAVQGLNTLVVHDVAGNAQRYPFTLN